MGAASASERMNVMSNEHIMNLLDGSAVTRLGRGEISAIEAHARDCDRCRRAYEAALVSASMLKARAAEAVEPQPFFRTRVMAAVRESRSEPPALVRLWRSAGALFAAMLMVVALLSTLSLFASYGGEEAVESAMAQSESFFEPSVFEDESADDQMSYTQVLDLVFEAEDGDAE
jgi:anti-sigma factor RsiW